MGFSSLSGRARTSARSPQAFGVCDRCGRWYNFVQLRWQFDWRGAALQNLRVLVCRDCYDVPQQQLRAIVLPQDPVPIINARPEPFLADEIEGFAAVPATFDPVTGIQYQIQDTIGGATAADQLAPQPVGREIPFGLPSLSGLAQMSPVIGVVYNQVIDVLSMTGGGTPQVNVTCSSPHGLTTGNQISVEGTTMPEIADGFFNATVVSGTAFNYTTDAIIPLFSVLGNKTIVKTTNAGIPLGMTAIPKTGL